MTLGNQHAPRVMLSEAKHPFRGWEQAKIHRDLFAEKRFFATFRMTEKRTFLRIELASSGMGISHVGFEYIE